MRVERQEILAAYNKGPKAVIRLVNGIVREFEKALEKLNSDIERDISALREESLLLAEENRELARRIAELESSLKTNSRNSSKPPSSDGLSKPPAKKRNTGRSPGGQQGHEGRTLRMVEDPDRVITHRVTGCGRCGHSLEMVTGVHEARQVFDLPPIAIEVTEHRAERKTCPRCGSLSRASFPEGVTQSAQYGERVMATAVYLNEYHLLPYKRLSEAMNDLFGCPVSQGTLVNAVRTASEKLRGAEQETKRRIAEAPVVCFDETGMRVEGKGAWLHVASTDMLTHYAIHPRRGRQATDEIGILPAFTGTAEHDCWSPYLTYDCSHALCCAHLIRELTFQAEECAQDWAFDMIELLREANETVKKAKEKRRAKLSRSVLKALERRYERILASGFAANPLPDARGQPVRRGRKKKTKTRNLLERLGNHRCEVLRFTRDFSVPFDNNLAERDLRMAKVKQKISGTFRSWEGAGDFCRIRGYISTVRKNGVPVIQAFADVFEGKLFVPAAAGT